MTQLQSARRQRLVAATMAGFALVAGSIAVGQASSAANHCDSSKVCLWGNDNYTAKLGTRAAGGGLSNLTSSTTKNETASWGNDTGTDACLYDAINGGGDWWELDSFNSNWLGTFDRDRGESWKTNGTAC